MSIKINPIKKSNGVENLCERTVHCGWCNTDNMSGIALDGTYQGKRRAQLYCAQCGARSPIAEGRTIRDAIAAAYAAATATPPNRPLTREQVEQLDDLDAVWCVHRHLLYPDCIEIAEGRYAKTMLEAYEGYETSFDVYLRKPSPADISAARAGKGEGYGV